jgi:hypothetical protein
VPAIFFIKKLAHSGFEPFHQLNLSSLISHELVGFIY